jgi:serine/threonine-protein kinase
MDAHEQGERIGAYRLESRLGRGGMGEVFLAWDDRLKRRVAIKRIRHDADVTAHRRERFRREAQAAASLSHPSIVQIHDIVEDGSGDCIVMEYIEGCTLAALLGSGSPLRPGLAARLAREIAEGLEAAHAAGFIHRDLKADNVIVTSAGRAKILDFGLAKPVGPSEGDSLTADGAVLGTWHAMSPEQARGGEVDARSDLFSLGVLLYEMLTGTSPFRGKSPLDTLQRVTRDQPRPVRTLRPEIPDVLSALVEHLLAKAPDARPRDARAVALELGRIERLPEVEMAAPAESTVAEPHPGSWGDLPTGEKPGPSPPIGRGRTLKAAALAAALLVAGFLAVLLRPPAAPLRVVVLKPDAAPADDARLRLAASSVLVAELSSLASLEGIAPLDPSQVDENVKTPVEIARLAAADEVLSARLEKDGEMARVSLRRIQGADGRVLWSRSFSVATEARDLRQLADAVQLQLRQAYAGHSLRDGTPQLEAHDEDYAAFVEVKSRVESDLPLDMALQRLEAIARSSPRFLDAQLLAAGAARSLFVSTRETAFRDRATALAARAQALSPNDPRPQTEHFLIALADDQPEKASAILTGLERQLPGDPEILVLRAQLARHQGKTEEALADLRTAVRRTPSWRNLFHLARLEKDMGRLDDARQHLQAVLQQSPRNVWGLTELANLELSFGDLRRAEELYLRLLAIKPRRGTFTNLGLTRFLLGRYGQATAAYREALRLDPGNPTVLLNLADAELALGRQAAAEALYREMIERLERDTSASDPKSGAEMTRAQGLVHLGRTREAVQLTQQALQRNPGDAEVIYQAALVYALAGDRASALVNVQAALEKGYQRRWFSIPTFGPLANDPELLALLAQPYTPPG